MTRPEPGAPSADDLAAMAYADGELSPAERAALEARMTREPALARSIAAQRRLAVLARAATPLEPAEQEWARLERSVGQRALVRGGRWLLALGVLALAAAGALAVARSALPPAVKLAAAALALGAALTLAAAWRARRRTRDLDPYEDVQR
jgi:anti-sigma factor RsiW